MIPAYHSYGRYPKEEPDKEYPKIESFTPIYAPSDYSEMKGDMAKALQEQMITTAQLATSLLTLNEKTEAMEVYIKAAKSKL